MAFDWSDIPETPGYSAYRIMLTEARNEARAKRRSFDLRIEDLLRLVREFELKREQICIKEDQLDDELERIKALGKIQPQI